MRQRSTEEKETKVSNFYDEWTSGVLNTLYDLYSGTRYKGLPLKGISLVTEKDKDGKQTVRINFVFQEVKDA